MTGVAVCAGAAVPVRVMKSGPLSASLSMTRVPVSAVGGVEGEPMAI